MPFLHNLCSHSSLCLFDCLRHAFWTPGISATGATDSSTSKAETTTTCSQSLLKTELIFSGRNSTCPTQLRGGISPTSRTACFSAGSARRRSLLPSTSFGPSTAARLSTTTKAVLELLVSCRRAQGAAAQTRCGRGRTRPDSSVWCGSTRPRERTGRARTSRSCACVVVSSFLPFKHCRTSPSSQL